MQSVNLFQTANASKALRAYSKPKMTTYGSVVEMTASGSLGAAELQTVQMSARALSLVAHLHKSPDGANARY